MTGTSPEGQKAIHAGASQAASAASAAAQRRTQHDVRAIEFVDTLPGGESATLHARFEAQVARTPVALAIAYAEEAITYAELNARANRLAHRLIAAGVIAEGRVGLCLERGIDLIVGVLGILKAGAAYVPLDPSYPQDRLAYMLGDSRPIALVTTARAVTSCGLTADVLSTGVVLVDMDQADSLADLSTLNPVHANADEDIDADAGRRLAYVIYTSGSTGWPKGVMIEHRSVLNLWAALDAEAYAHCAPDARIGLNAALSFDASVQSLTQLLSGRCVVMIPQAVRTDAAAMSRFLDEQRIDAFDCTPTQLQALVQDGLFAGRVRAPQVVLVGGEPMPAALWSTMALSGARCFNVYGPTECTVDATLARIDQAALAPHIGRPLAGTEVRIVDADGIEVSSGEAGELLIGGVQVARGYLGRDDLTAQRFIDDPRQPGARLYRTGDLGRWTPEGNIEYLGRNDFQIKLRGYRIELGEIEARLTACAGVRDAVVLAREDRPGDVRLVAYCQLDDGVDAHARIGSLRSELQAVLPEYMLPSAMVAMTSWPMTPSGKRDYAALQAPGTSRPELAQAYEPPRNPPETAVCAAFGLVLGIDGIGRHDGFFDLGGNSLLAARLLAALRGAGSVEAARLGAVAVTVLFQHPTPAGFVAAARSSMAGDFDNGIDRSRLGRAARLPLASAEHVVVNEPIAIIAMAGRFPGSDSVEGFWRNLLDGRDSITFFDDGDLDASISADECGAASYIAARGVIDGVELFDAAFFGISPREAELMDPQQRILLELCWECMERGGHVPGATAGPVGVFAGMNNGTYLQRNVAAHPELVEKLGAFQVMVANEKDYIATRVAHKLDLTGPAISTHTACSTSLVAICQAVDSLRAGQCDMALAGAASVVCPPRSGYHYQEGSMLSPDGHTRTFDSAAQGTVFGDGAAVVLLKRLSDAQADGDTVIALIRGGAINNDGGRKASFTAPSSDGQAAVIAMAQRAAGVEARSIGYVEAHGTATPLGDPIEIEGLTKAFRMSTADAGFCRIGSVKSNVGHLVAAAGATGVIKAALSLRDGVLPASLHFSAPNPTIPFDGSPFVVNAERREWTQGEGGAPRRAGVSSFGVGGTNAHVVLEEAPLPIESDTEADAVLLSLSARSPTALANAVTALADHLDADAPATSPQTYLADVAWTLAVGRKAFAHRISLVAKDAGDAVTRLRAIETTAAVARSRPARGGEVAFLFPGQGSQYAGMGRELYRVEPAFREACDACFDALDATPGTGLPTGVQLRDAMFGDDVEAMLPTSVMQPAIFTIEYATARLWMHHGVTPVAMIGHSIGEFVAATIAGVFAVEDAVRLVARRGQLMQAQPSGAMLSVRLPLATLQSRLPEGIDIAAENGPSACVVSGPAGAIAGFSAELEADGFACRALRTSHAFHSAMMDAVVAPFRDEVARLAAHAPMIPIVSTASGDWLHANDAQSPDYWATHLRKAVRFDSALSRVIDGLADGSPRVLLEVGPRSTLSGLAKQRISAAKLTSTATASLVDSVDAEVASFRAAAGQLWCRGAVSSLAGLDHRQRRQRVCLPTYPFERQRYWVEPAAATAPTVRPATRAAAVDTPVSMSTVASATVPELPMSAMPVMRVQPSAAVTVDRLPRVIARLTEVFEDVAGFDVGDADQDANFIEIGLDSLSLTQVALQLQKTFNVRVTFRQLMTDYASLRSLAGFIDAQLPADVAAVTSEPVQAQQSTAGMSAASSAAIPGNALPTPFAGLALSGLAAGQGNTALVQQVIAQQMQMMSQHLALLAGLGAQGNGAMPLADAAPQVAAVPAAQALDAWTGPADAQRDVPPALSEARSIASLVVSTDTPTDDDPGTPQSRYDVQKAFGAIARIHSNRLELSSRQQRKLQAFVQRYVARTPKSKAYTQQHRPHMADPRVVSGFRPLWKEIVYQTVIEGSQGAHLTDIDGNDYVDANNGFGMSLFGWQPDFVLDAVRAQLDIGYEIGPQSPLSGEVCRLVCELTGHDRAGLCNTGSEAVLGAMRVARTVTGRSLIVVFNGSYHGINDEVVVRGNRKGQAMPGAPGILRDAVDNILVLEYGTPEALETIRARAHELAAVLVEPVQSRRPDLQPIEFLRELREITLASETVLVFDEVITGFRAHPGGTQAMFGVKADLATYGKVIGGGYPLGVIAGKRAYMDALDGGHWQYGDDSVPTVGVTYFAGTFVRHPLALAATRAVLQHLVDAGPQLQVELTARTTAFADDLNSFCREVGAPIEIRHFASLWRTHWLEEHPLQDLLFAMIRSRGVHILDNFPCYLTTAHSDADIAAIARVYKDSVLELQEAEFLPRRVATTRTVMHPDHPPVPGARIGREADGSPAWFVADDARPGKYRQVAG